jgi:hypothetical protein
VNLNLVSIPGAAKLAGVSHMTIRRAYAAGHITGERVDPYIVLDRGSVERWAHDRTHHAS